MILNVNKPQNITSRDVVNQIAKILGTKKVGHTGTLDPLATGVLLICTDQDTKLVEILTATTKEYIATIKLGIKTDTGDITGNIIEKKEYSLTKEQIEDTLNSFLGKSIQTVPIYSAIKVNGKKLYEYARNNEPVTLPRREIEIKEIKLLKYNNDWIKFRVIVSKGTYIRSLIEDICEQLDTVGTMQELIRTKQGYFKLENSFNIKDIENKTYVEIPLEEVLKDYEVVEINDENLLFKIKNGAIIPKTFQSDLAVIKYNQQIIAIYQTYLKDKTKAKPYIMLGKM